jgi:hypothetical protein
MAAAAASAAAATRAVGNARASLSERPGGHTCRQDLFAAKAVESMQAGHFSEWTSHNRRYSNLRRECEPRTHHTGGGAVKCFTHCR